MLLAPPAPPPAFLFPYGSLSATRRGPTRDGVSSPAPHRALPSILPLPLLSAAPVAYHVASEVSVEIRSVNLK